MRFTLHLTNACNFRCVYCTQKHSHEQMNIETVRKACELSGSADNSTGFCFYGGEPLLNFALIEEIFELTDYLALKNNHHFNFKMNTNGFFLTEENLHLLCEHKVGIGLSFDGAMQDDCRKTVEGKVTHDIICEKAKLLLKHQPQATVQAVIAPQSAGLYSSSVEELFNLGFRNILTTPAYGKNVCWDDASLGILNREYQKTAALYESWLESGEHFWLSAFDAKLSSSIDGSSRHACHMGRGQYSITTDGRIYPCTQFAENDFFCLGNLFDGIDLKKQAAVSAFETTPDVCRQCALKQRCISSCGCLNMSETGTFNKTSAFHCEHERMLVEISDELGESLYENQRENFLKKFYNNSTKRE